MTLEGWNAVAGFDLTSPVRRMTPKRKYSLLRAVDDGAISAQRVREIHGISQDEWDEWVSKAEFGVLIDEEPAFKMRRS